MHLIWMYLFSLSCLFCMCWHDSIIKNVICYMLYVTVKQGEHQSEWFDGTSRVHYVQGKEVIYKRLHRNEYLVDERYWYLLTRDEYSHIYAKTRHFGSSNSGRKVLKFEILFSSSSLAKPRAVMLSWLRAPMVDFENLLECLVFHMWSNSLMCGFGFIWKSWRKHFEHVHWECYVITEVVTICINLLEFSSKWSPVHTYIVTVVRTG